MTAITLILMPEEKEEKSEVYEFGDCVLDAGRRELSAAGQVVSMQPKAFELLLYLVRNRDRAIDKDELQNHLWPRSIVTETALTRCVMKARRAVNDDADRQHVIKTVHSHGYRFVGDLRPAQPVDTGRQPGASEPRQPEATWRRWLAGAGAAIVLLAAWWFVANPVHGKPVRLAVLPVVNNTGETEFDWASNGFMALINRLLEDRAIAVVDNRSISKLADTGNPTGADSAFRASLQKTTGFTHLLAAALDKEGDIYRLSFELSSSDDQPERRTFVGPEPIQLVSQLVETAATIITRGAPEPPRETGVSSDDFINEAYARAMNLEMEGRYSEALDLLQVIIQQDPSLFWPRYEYALCSRNLRDFATAERLFLTLRSEAEEQANLKRQAAVNNSLGIMYMGNRRNDDALAAFENTVRIATELGDWRYLGTAQQNLGLLAKNLGDIPLAYQHMQDATAAFSKLDIESLPGTLLNNMSGVLIQLGRLEEAEQYANDAIDNFRLTGERLFESYALSRLAGIYRRSGLLDDAESAAQSSYAVRVELGDTRGTAASILTLADIAYDRGDLTRSLQYARQAIDIGAEIDDQDVTMDALNTAAKAELALHEPRAAIANYTAAEAIGRNADSRQTVFAARYGVGRAWIEIGDYATATAIADELLTDARSNGRRREETAGLNLHAEILRAQAQWQDAIARLEEVLAIADEIGDTSLAAGAHAGLADALLSTGQIEQAADHIDRILAQRPPDTEALKLQARLAALRGQADQALDYMTAARSRAGESWQASDEQLLQSYRDTTATDD